MVRQGMTSTVVSLSSLTVDMALYPRKRIDWGRVERYADAMRAGATFPEIKYAEVKGKHVVIDGVHRYHARKKIKHQTILAEDLGVMTEGDAFAAAVKYNVGHGKALTSVEKLDAYKRLLEQGHKIEKISEILAIPKDRVERWAAKTVHDASGRAVWTAPGGNGNHSSKRLVQLVVALKNELVPGISGKETVEHLRGLRNLIKERYDADVVKAMAALDKELEELLESLTSEEGPLS
jgi:hypothetical protein